jgi:predicted  nucleic acid-binding Zn-ribbon protein
LREQLLSLLQLQTFDVKVRELDIAAKQLPAKLDPLRRDLAKLQGMLDVERAKLGETETWRKTQQDMIDRDREQLKAAQSKLQQSKNSKEFGAASREVENKRKSIGDRETELKKVLETTQQSNSQLSARDAARNSVDKSWLKTYDSLSAKRGYAVAPVIKGTCQGCHMALPPQLNNILARMQSIEMCPRCGRLVYRKELLEPKAEGGGGEAPKS